MLGFYVLLEDPDANVIIMALHCCSGFFGDTRWVILIFRAYAILLINPGRWQQANTQQPIGVVGLVIIHVNVRGPSAKREVFLIGSMRAQDVFSAANVKFSVKFLFTYF